MENTITLNFEELADYIGSHADVEAEAKEICLDFGARLFGKTIVIKSYNEALDSERTYQLLNFREIDEVKDGIFTVDMAEKLVDKINNRGW